MVAWFSYLSNTQKALLTIAAALALGFSIGVSTVQIAQLPNQVKTNTARIVSMDSSRHVWQDQVLRRFDRLENAVIYHMCEADSQPLTECIPRMRRQLNSMNGGYIGPSGYGTGQ